MYRRVFTTVRCVVKSAIAATFGAVSLYFFPFGAAAVLYRSYNVPPQPPRLALLAALDGLRPSGSGPVFVLLVWPVRATCFVRTGAPSRLKLLRSTRARGFAAAAGGGRPA